MPVTGSPWRADREASWQLAAVRRTAQVIVYDRMLRREESDRTTQPEWQTHSTEARAWATMPPHAPSWSRPVRWLRGALYGAALRTGLFKAETVVGAPTENSDGCFWVARGSASGPLLNGSVNLCGKAAGIAVRGITGSFGAALSSPHVEN
ncbi:hypothetical protein [Streptomyces sp. NPDC017991]|uniref:hypothetical protein n=1 Tax=Streptomyces sp. NPDC017991 TaxID=3365026 RepID=UPI00379FF7FB